MGEIVPLANAIAAKEAREWLPILSSTYISNDDLRRFWEWRKRPENLEAFTRAAALRDGSPRA